MNSRNQNGRRNSFEVKEMTCTHSPAYLGLLVKLCSQSNNSGTISVSETDTQ